MELHARELWLVCRWCARYCKEWRLFVDVFGSLSRRAHVVVYIYLFALQCATSFCQSHIDVLSFFSTPNARMNKNLIFVH